MVVICDAVNCRHNSKDTMLVVNYEDKEMERHYCTNDMVTILNDKRYNTQKNEKNGNYTWCVSYRQN